MGACCAKCCKKKDSPGVNDIERNRSCKDIICLVVFIACFCGSVGVGIFASGVGRPESLIYGSDSLGNTCGADNTLTSDDSQRAKCRADKCYFSTGKKVDGKYAQIADKDDIITINYLESKLKYVAYPRLNEDIIDIVAANDGEMPTDPSDFNFFGICLEKCPEQAGWTCSSYGHAIMADTMGEDMVWDVKPGSDKEKELDNCKAEADGMGVSGILLSSFTKALSGKCNEYLDHCFYTPIQMSNTFFRCFPNYNQTIKYGCDDDGNGIMDAGTRSVPYTEKEAADCQTMLEIATTQKQAQPNFVYDQISSTFAVVGRMMGDVQQTMVPIFVTGTVAAILLGFAWLLLLRYCAMVFVWATILLVVSFMVTTCYILYIQAGMLPNPMSGEPVVVQNSTMAANSMLNSAGIPTSDVASTDLFRGLAILMTIITVIQIVVIVALKHNINVAARIIQEASRAMASMPMLSVLPLPLVGMVFILFLWFVYNLMCLMSAEPFSTEDMATYGGNSSLVPQTGGNDLARYLSALQFFMFLWQNQFVQGIGMMTVSGSVCTWYWTPPRQSDGVKHQSTRVPILDALVRTLRYHLGSVAMGSFLVALVQFLRAVLAYIEKKTPKKAQTGMMKCFMKILHCILLCFEKCVKFISRNAYVLIAQNGYSFCHACKDIFHLLTTHMGQISATSMITNYLMILGKIVITGASLAVGYVWMNALPAEDQPTSLFVPLLCTGLLAFGVAATFLLVYDIAIDTILVLFLIDLDKNDGSNEKPYYMPVSLAKMEHVKGITAQVDDDGNVIGGPESDGKDDGPVKQSKITPVESTSQSNDDEMV